MHIETRKSDIYASPSVTGGGGDILLSSSPTYSRL